ncbi:DUF6412 domain-containing protein [Pseudonocardia sp. N23]|uniref:DUF6412 domain-containing protein n=1 Tax=Pseudonocardia sp. N23 TaxID=1987376 RepID=UPI000BFCFBCA|nr:DUF6412 domain-containing protein [Pseudonocardia sp. N23]GAY09372.1 hypothetical protein TOK_3351 [Pseudonocardia sp. N23]
MSDAPVVRYRRVVEAEGVTMRGEPTLQALVLLVTGFALLAGEPGVVIGVLGAVLWAWGMARHASAVMRVAAAPLHAVTARALRQARSRCAPPRQEDPDAAGHTRARAPSGLLPAV